MDLEYECIDRISDMPDSILGKILYFVPTKDAVATSILSSRWKNLFPFALTHINLDLNDFKRLSPSFMNFVDKLFNETLLSEPCVDRISIRCDGGYGEEKIVSWLCSALRLKVVHFCLFCKLNNTETLFHSLNGCTTLQELELGSKFEFCVPEDFFLPNLKKVSLHSIILHNHNDSLHTLLSCPMLEHLTLNECLWKALYIKSSVLKKLFIMRCLGFEVHINAPKLESFLYACNAIVEFVMEDSDSLRSAIIELDSICVYTEIPYGINVHRLGHLVKGCSSTIRLYLTGYSIMAFVYECVRLPMFMNLTCLVLGLLKGHGFEILARLLNNAPNLQTLTIVEGFKNCQGGYASFESLLPSLPDCLKLCFKKIEICEFRGEEDGIKFIEYFLKNGRMLGEVRVIYLPFVDMSVLDRLMMFPRYSKTCEIFLMEKDNRASSRSFANWF